MKQHKRIMKLHKKKVQHKKKNILDTLEKDARKDLKKVDHTIVKDFKKEFLKKNNVIKKNTVIKKNLVRSTNSKNFKRGPQRTQHKHSKKHFKIVKNKKKFTRSDFKKWSRNEMKHEYKIGKPKKSLMKNYHY